MDNTISGRLLELRHTLCLTQKDFGEKIHISRGYVTSLEKCRQPINNRIVKLISDTYGVNADWLKTGRGDMFIDPNNSRLLDIIAIFNQLNPDFQNFIVNQLKYLLKMNDNYQSGNDCTSNDNTNDCSRTVK